MRGHYKVYHWSITVYTGLSLVNFIVWRHFFDLMVDLRKWLHSKQYAWTKSEQTQSIHKFNKDERDILSNQPTYIHGIRQTYIDSQLIDGMTFVWKIFTVCLFLRHPSQFYHWCHLPDIAKRKNILKFSSKSPTKSFSPTSVHIAIARVDFKCLSII